jgi:UDP-3-O-[3-hydroxymyristoyl] glucosamine N-acyltransferase
MINPFFKNHGPFLVTDLASNLNINSLNFPKTDKVNDIKDLQSAKIGDITFFSF